MNTSAPWIGLRYRNLMKPRENEQSQLMLIALLLVTMTSVASFGADEGSKERAVALPPSLIGVWTPYSSSFAGFGDLRLAPDTISWGDCLYEEYRVIRTDEQPRSYSIEVLRRCSFQPFLIFEFSESARGVSDAAVEVFICPKESGLDRARGFCSSGILVKNE
jgi:hypothetical protein